jgi:hypothetical protein
MGQYPEVKLLKTQLAYFGYSLKDFDHEDYKALTITREKNVIDETAFNAAAEFGFKFKQVRYEDGLIQAVFHRMHDNERFPNME